MKNKIVKDTLALTVITLVSGLLLGLVNDITAGPIASQQAKEKEEAYKAVFADAASFETVTSGEDTDLESYLDENGFKAQNIDEVMLAKDDQGNKMLSLYRNNLRRLWRDISLPWAFRMMEL